VNEELISCHIKMKALHDNDCRAFTLIELLVVISIIGVLAAFLLPSLASTQSKAKRTQCVNNVKQIALALRMWANEHGDKFPWQVTQSEGGSMQDVPELDWAMHFRVCSEELGTPKVLVCPADASKQPLTTRWEDLDGAMNISYFVGKSADETKPLTLLTGDANLEVANANDISSSQFTWTDAVGTSIMVQFEIKVHGDSGNIALSDGSVQSVTSMGLRELIMTALSSGSGSKSISSGRREVTISVPRRPI
jgi:prepilin-type N-terminal cleavage/methylation domain-containing protein